MRQLTGGWQLSPIFTAYSGQPITITDNGKDVSQTGQLLDRPNVAAPNAVIPSTQTVKSWFNQAAFAVQPTGTYGNAGRFAVTGPGAWNLDLGLSRNFRFRERWNLETRGEAFNLFNHGNWNSPGTGLGSSTFGQITTFGSPRIVQLALKFSF